LALEAAPELDERLLGQFIGVLETPDGEFSQATYVEIEVYARQIVEQLALVLSAPNDSPAGAISSTAVAVPPKAYDIAVIRTKYHQAYAPWSEEDDDYVRARYLEGATMEELVGEFKRQPSAIRSRLRKLGLTKSRALVGAQTHEPHAEQAPSVDEPESASAQSVPEWKRLRSRAGKAWTAEEDTALLGDLAAGFSLDEIARRLGRGVFAVEVRLSKLGRGASDGGEGPAELGNADSKADDKLLPPDDGPLSGWKGPRT
jgi:hypothetical protein